MATVHTYPTRFGDFIMAGKQLKARESSGVVGELCVTFSFTVDEMAQIQAKYAPGETSRMNLFSAMKTALGIIPSEKPKPAKVEGNTVDLGSVIAAALKMGHTEQAIIEKLRGVGFTDEQLKPHCKSLQMPQQSDILSLFS